MQWMKNVTIQNGYQACVMLTTLISPDIFPQDYEYILFFILETCVHELLYMWNKELVTQHTYTCFHTQTQTHTHTERGCMKDKK